MELSDEQKQQLKTILKEQSKIAAIKECRAMTNLGLAESKQLVDGLEAELKAEGWEPARGGCMGVMLLAVALAGWLGG
ncbi:MAG: ribosomal protein L7/L12 [Planctomycetota bacterium]|nr:ribosomal protein L7/L12 [Planctomycetota bacterium]